MTTSRIRIFKPGTFTDVKGREVAFTEQHLRDAAASYDYASDPAPLVVGHPALDAPAYGWVRGLAFEDGHLVADPDKVVPEFSEAVNAGRFAKVSASFYPPEHPSNPKPDSFYLKHVGFLGAAAPAVKGLGTVSFSEADQAGLVTVDFAQESPMETPEFAERTAALDARETSIAARETAAAEREAAATATARQALHQANVSFAEALIAGGSLAPAGKDLVVGVLDQLEATAPVSFGETLGELAPATAFKKLFEGAGKIVAFGEIAAPGDESEPAEDPSDIADRALAYAEEQKQAGRIITVAAAVRHVTKPAG